jgi:hypothetical protein
MAKGNSSRRKKISLKKKPMRRKKPPHSKGPRRSPSAQIHQGVGPGTPSHSETMPEIPDDAAEYGGES